MSTAIRDAEIMGTKKIDTIRRRQEKEIKNLESNHDKNKTEIRKSQEGDILDIQDNHKNQVNAESIKKEKVLQDMRTHLQKTEEMTDKELRELKTATSKTKMAEEEKLGISREMMNEDNKLHLEEMNYRFTDQSKKINQSNQNQLDKVKQEFLDTKMSNEEFNKDRIQKQTQNFTTRYNVDEANYKKIKYDQDNQFKKERVSTNLRQQSEMAKMVDNHQVQLEKRDDHFRKGVKDQDLFFEKKYTEHLKKNNTDMKALEDLNNKMVEKMKVDMAREIDKMNVRSSDPFYQFTELKPVMTETPEHVIVKVSVPEYSKQDLQLGLNSKEIIINYNRRYTDANKNEAGVKNKVNKVESFSSRLTASAFLDPKNVNSVYENGVMTYTIKKA